MHNFKNLLNFFFLFKKKNKKKFKYKIKIKIKQGSKNFKNRCKSWPYYKNSKTYQIS